MESVLPICRVCLNVSTECVDLQTTFVYKEQDEKVGTIKLNYIEGLRFCTQLPINNHDDEPQYLCAACVSELHIVFKFLQKARNSQSILEESWKRDNSEVITEILIKKIQTMKDNENEHLIKEESTNESIEDCASDISSDIKYETEEVVIKSDESQHHQFMSEDAESSQENLERPFFYKNKCHICHRTYTTDYLLRAHLKYHERRVLENKSDACEICGKHFSTQRYLAQHMIVHQDKREILQCHYCDKEYLTKTALNNHKRIHQGQTFECTECGKQFTRSYELKIHMRFHKREYPFECTMCEKKFAIKGHLRTHMWQHQGIKLECEECGKLFGSTKAINEHSYTHTKMPYPCDFCNKAYPSRQKYKVHLEKLHSNEIKEIDLLQLKSFSSAKNLKKRKSFTYVKIIDEQEAEKHKQLTQLINNA